MGKRSTTLFCCLIGVLCLSGAMGDPLDYSPGYIRFPFARSGSDFTNICKGYGDFNAGSGLILFHSGVDIQAEDTTEYVRTPFNPAYVLRVDQGSFPNEWRLILATSPSPGAVSGWGYHHLYKPAGFSQGDTLFDLIEPVIAHPLGPHVHIDWCVHVDSIKDQQLPGGVWVFDVYNSYINPLDFFLNKPQNYDYPELGWVPYSNTGLRIQSLWKTEPEDYIPDTTVYGQVHFVARPVSAPQQQQGLSSDSVGVRYLRHRVLRQDPYTGEYLPFPWYDWRTLFSMNGFIPYLGNAFFDFVYAIDSGHYRSEYILNNCGTTPVGLNADSAFTNVWTAGYDRSQDWADGVFCRGAFDTRLGFDFIHQQSYDNGTAMIPDGRYCVEMEAYSHGSSQAQTWRLPVLDVEAENLSPGDSANVRGFIVDNFAPHVESVLVYLEALPGEPDTVYSAEWALATESLRFLTDSTRMYLSSDEEQWIGVALKLSEPMDSLPDLWITGEWGGEVRWSSTSVDQFTPCEWDELNLGEMPVESNGSGFWQCYRTELGITGYHGSLRLNIGGGMDLSGNPLDGAPATIAARDTLSGVFSGYEQVDDCSYEWQVEPPMYLPNDQFPCCRYVTGCYTPNSGSGALILPLDPGQRAMFFVPSDQFSWGPPGEGRCPYWHGFWLAGAALVGGTGNSYKVLITGFDGRTSASFTGNTRFPFNQFEEPSYSGIMNNWMILSGAGMGDYCWIGVTSIDSSEGETLQSTDIPGPPGCTYLDVHCFTATGGYAEYSIAAGETVWWHSFEHHPSDENKIIVKYRLSSGGAIHTTVLTPPGSDEEFPGIERITLEDERQSVQDEGSVNVFGLSVSCNPVSSQVMLQVSLEQGGLVELTIHDLTGREVQRVLDEEMPAGVHSIASQVNLPSGVYFCRLRSGGNVATGKLVIVR